MSQPPSDWQIEFFANSSGDSPVLEFINTLTVKERGKIRDHLKLLKEFGVGLGLPHAKPLSGHKPLWELRPMPHRLIYVAVSGRKFVVLHAFKKEKNKTPKKDLKVAEKRYQIVKEREG
ncbi:MAG: type II toxin-antitoxin system RelE/ParE family toxin [Chloroflexi bacterium]|nr:type II toxin-antitoxin system RelE/ParE family toxin [Chloroflexota bacterium]